MRILDLLIKLEEMGCICIAREGQGITYGLDERGKTPMQVSRLERRLVKFMEPHKPLLLKWLRPMPKDAAFVIFE